MQCRKICDLKLKEFSRIATQSVSCPMKNYIQGAKETISFTSLFDSVNKIAIFILYHFTNI